MPRIVDAEERRGALCDAVVMIAADGGLGAVTVRSLAQRVGGSTTAITHYVGGREELVVMAVEREARRWRTRFEGKLRERSGLERLRVLATEATIGVTEIEQRAWVAFATAAVLDPLVRRALASFDDWWDAELRQSLRECGLRGSALDRTQVAIDALVTGLVFSRATTTSWSKPRARREIERLIDLVALAPHG